MKDQELCCDMLHAHSDTVKRVRAAIPNEDTLIDLERISDHCSNIAIAIIELKNENLDSHSYLLSLSKSDDSTFAQIYNAFKAAYYLDGKDDIVTKEN